jgi:hypothetical protein
MAMMQCTELRIGATEAGLLELRYRDIPDPEDWTFRPYSVQRTNGNGLPVSYGFPTCEWSWDALDQNALGVLLAFFAADTDAGVKVFISTYTDTGRRRTTTDYTAYMQRPIDGDGKSMYPGSVGQVSQNVTLSFTHLEAV